MSTRSVRTIVLALAVALLSACATPPAAPPSSLLPAIPEQFVVAGRFAARHGNEGVSGRFQWAVEPGKEQWRLAAPTGTLLAELTLTQEGAELVTADGQHHFAPHPEVLLAAILPGELPPWALWRQLLWGHLPEASGENMTAGGAPQSGLAAGWQWRLQMGSDHWPQRLEATRGETTIILVIEERAQP